MDLIGTRTTVTVGGTSLQKDDAVVGRDARVRVHGDSVTVADSAIENLLDKIAAQQIQIDQLGTRLESLERKLELRE